MGAAGRFSAKRALFSAAVRAADERVNLPLAKLSGTSRARGARRSLAGIGTSAPLRVGTSETVSVPALGRRRE